MQPQTRIERAKTTRRTSTGIAALCYASAIITLILSGQQFKAHEIDWALFNIGITIFNTYIGTLNAKIVKNMNQYIAIQQKQLNKQHQK